MPAIYQHLHTVRADEIDALGHANNVVYVEWMQAAALTRPLKGLDKAWDDATGPRA